MQARTYLIHCVSSVIVSPGVTILEVDLTSRARFVGLSFSTSSMDSSLESLSEAAGEPYSGLSLPIVGGRMVIAIAGSTV